MSAEPEGCANQGLRLLPRAVERQKCFSGCRVAQTTRIVRTEMERGVFDIEAVKKANATLVATINESLQIADEGKAKRAAAEVELVKMEGELRDTLASARARTA